jgi:site-specific DNA recombinase
MEDMLTTEYDGCGRCLVAVRRLSRKTDKTSSPQRQGDQDLRASVDAGGHIIAWADDWEVSGATDPMTRKGLGPWLRGEMGPYDGIVAPTVDRVGRNVRDTLNTQTLLTGQGRVIVTADHAGVWDFTDGNQENEWLIGVGVTNGTAGDSEAQPG